MLRTRLARVIAGSAVIGLTVMVVPSQDAHARVIAKTPSSTALTSVLNVGPARTVDGTRKLPTPAISNHPFNMPVRKAPLASTSGAKSTPATPAPKAVTAKKVGVTGLSYCDEGAGCWTPPDSGGLAVGSSQIVEVTNSAIRVYAKPTTGATSLTKQYGASLNTFFGYSGASMFDPRAWYDTTWKRFVVVSDSFNDSSGVQRVWIAVSKTGNPNPSTGGAWWVYGFSSWGSASNTFFDFPMLGSNQDALILTANIFNNANAYVTTEAIAIAKARLYNGLGFSVPIASGLGGTTAAPVVMDQSPEINLIAYNSGSTFLKWKVLNAAYAFSISYSNASIPIAAFSAPPSSPQLGGPNVDSGDGRVSSSTTQAGTRLWAARAIALGSFSAVHWYELDTNTNSVVQEATRFVDSTSFDYNPSIAYNPSSGMTALSWSASSSTRYPFTVAASRKSTEAANVMGAPVTIIASAGPVCGGCSGVARFGDYSSTVVDSGNTAKFWFENELGTVASGSWTTSVGFAIVS